MYSVTLEPTSRCTLACPRCARTDLLEKFGTRGLTIADLDPEHVLEFFDRPIEYFYLGGTYGDPIIHPRLADLVISCKAHAPRVVINTSGSGRNSDWWKKFVEVLTPDDEIEFAIDGIPSNFTQYRVNANWEQIEDAIKQCVGRVKTTWKYIPFSYNENDVDTAKQISVNLGMDQFNVEPSDRWIENDWLKPTKFTGPNEGAKADYKSVNSIVPRCANYRNQYTLCADILITIVLTVLYQDVQTIVISISAHRVILCLVVKCMITGFIIKVNGGIIETSTI